MKIDQCSFHNELEEAVSKSIAVDLSAFSRIFQNSATCILMLGGPGKLCMIMICLSQLIRERIRKFLSSVAGISSFLRCSGSMLAWTASPRLAVPRLFLHIIRACSLKSICVQTKGSTWSKLTNGYCCTIEGDHKERLIDHIDIALIYSLVIPLPLFICSILSSPPLTIPTSLSQATPNTFTPSPPTGLLLASF